MPIGLVGFTWFSTLMNVHRGETFFMVMGGVGAILITNKAIEGVAVKFPKMEQTWLDLDQKMRELKKHGYTIEDFGWRKTLIDKFNKLRGKNQ